MPDPYHKRATACTVVMTGKVNAYELLGLPLWTRDPQRISRACREQIERIRQNSDSARLPQQSIDALLSAQDMLTSPGARDEYNDRLRTELIERAEQVTAGFDGHARNDEIDGELVVSAANLQTVALAPSRAENSTVKLAVAEVSSGEREHVTHCNVVEHSTTVTQRPIPNDRSVSWRRSVVPTIRFVLAVVVTAVAINVAFFRPHESDDFSGSDMATEKRPRSTGRASVLPAIAKSVPSSKNKRDAVSNRRMLKDAPADRDANVRPTNLVESDLVAKVAQPEQKADRADNAEPGDGAAAGLPQVAKPPVPQPDAVDLQPDGLAIASKVSIRPLPEFSNPDERLAFAKSLRDLLYEGFTAGKEAQKNSSVLFQQAHALSKDDPRLYYGYGLVLWKRLKYSEAFEQFERATQVDRTYWPAQQALIRLNLARDPHDAAFDRLGEMVHDLSIQRPLRMWADDRRAAYWIGRLMGYLNQTDNQVKPDPRSVQVAQSLIERRFNEELLGVYRAGERQLNDEFAALIAQSEQKVAKEMVRAIERSEEKLKSIEKDLELQKDRKDKVDRTAREWKDWIGKQSSKADEQLEKLAGQFNSTYQQALVYRRAIARLDQDVVDAPLRMLDRLMRQSPLQSPPPRLPALNPVRQTFGAQPAPVDSYSATRLHYEAKYKQLDSEAAIIRQRAEDVVRRRHQAVLRYQQATGELVEQSDAVRKWFTTLEKQKQSITEAKESPVSSRKARSILRKARALDSHIAFDPAAERQRLLESLPPK